MWFMVSASTAKLIARDGAARLCVAKARQETNSPGGSNAVYWWRGMEQPAAGSRKRDRKQTLRAAAMPFIGGAGWSSPVARQAHNLKVVGSNPTPATNKITGLVPVFLCLGEIRICHIVNKLLPAALC
jgi:hypothetical protein